MDTNSKSHVHALFETIAPKYDFMNDVISFRRHKAWRKYTMNKMNVQKGQNALDICCGTGDWTIDLANTSQTGKIVGLDFSQNMLNVAEVKVAKLSLGRQIELVQGNAMNLPYEDNTFDYVTIGFGLRNVPDYLQVLREMHRVVKPGGKVVCLELSKPTWQPFKSIYNFYFERIMPIFGKMLANGFKEYQWLPISLRSFPDSKQLTELFNQAGLQGTKVDLFFGGIAALHMGTKGNDGQL
ncbi:demethylmenaquinone methyltransferase [Paenibacillus sp. GSMTC-2017]|uniref:demethylmenaquinone methyltransferase n=1 Tax=Paenibacillus sp. GSMTC-2017 TaxID=2794350 RepID=UPI0018DA0419|nr:demethylmenaquinone methyltransferase [Paenibacillus sp. GSMTC-2017]